MKDRTSSGSVYYNTLEYASKDSIQNTDFEEGIIHIGSYLFYGDSSSLKPMKLPTTLETIGSHVFYSCSASQIITFWGNAQEIASNVFKNATAICRYLAWGES